MCSQSRDTTVCISRCLRLLFVRRMRSSRFWPSLTGSLGRARARHGARALLRSAVVIPGTQYPVPRSTYARSARPRASALARWREPRRAGAPARLGQHLELRMRRTKRRRRQREIQTVVSLDWLHIRRLKLHHDTQCLIENRSGYSIP